MHTNDEHARAVNFQVSEAEYRALRMHAAQNGTTTRQVLREAIAQITGKPQHASGQAKHANK